MKKVMVFGTFDILHPGHINFFQQAKKFGKLIVVIGRDQTVKKLKEFKSTNSEKDRQNLVASVRLVDKAVLGDLKDQMKVIRKYQPDIICLGYDQKAFVDQLYQNFPNLKIVRLRPYKSDKYKTAKLRSNKKV